MKRDTYTEKRNGNNGRGIIFCLLRQTNHPRPPPSFVGVVVVVVVHPHLPSFPSLSRLPSPFLSPFQPPFSIFLSSFSRLSSRTIFCLSFSGKRSARSLPRCCNATAIPDQQNPRSPRLDICQINRVVSGWRGSVVSYSIARINHPSV